MTRIAEADKFIQTLGLEAYRVGGSVRDELLGRKPKDADYLIRGTPMDNLRDSLTLQGAKVTPIKARDMAHLGWRAHVRDLGLIEVVLPRIESNFGFGRQQLISVDPDLSLDEDAKRRDFTFNALYKIVSHPDNLHTTVAGPGGRSIDDIVDPLGGVDDLHRRIVRTTHADSFRDDPLRILRALRFISTLDADLAVGVENQMRMYASEVDGWMQGGVSGTVLDELKKLLMGQCPAKALRIARDTGVLAVAFPELAPMLGFDQGSRYHDLTTDEHTFKALETAAHVDAPLRVRMALLFHDAGKPESAWKGRDRRLHYYEPSDKVWEEAHLQRMYEAGDIYLPIQPKPKDHEVVGARLWDEAAARLNVDRKLRNDVRTLILNHMVPVKTRNLGTRVRRMRVKLGDELLRDLFMHRTCDLSGKQGKVALNHIEHVAKMERTRAAAAAAGVPASIKDLQISGKDAIAAGLEGPDIGRVLSRVLDEVVCEPDGLRMSRDWQLRRMEALA